MEPDPAPLLTARLPRSVIGVSLFAALILSFEALLLVALPWPIRFAVDELFVPVPANLGPRTSTFLSSAFASMAATFPDSFLHWLSRLPGGAAYLFFIVTLMVVVMTAYAVLSRAGESLKIRIARRVLQLTRHHLLHSIVTREQTYIDNRVKDDLMARLTCDLDDLNDLVINTLGVIGYNFTALVASLAVMASLDFKLALMMGAALPIVYSANGSLLRFARLSEKRRESDGIRLEREFSGLVKSLPSLKSLAAEDSALESLSHRSAKFDERSATSQKAEASMRILRLTVRNFLRTLVLLVGGRAVLVGELTLGSLVLFFFYAEILNQPVIEISHFMSRLSHWRAAVGRIEALFRDLEGHEEHEGRQNISSLPFPDATSLHFENVHFKFDIGMPLIEDFSADFRAGELIAVAGPRGSGKSIFAKLTNRLLDPTQGKIALGRTDLRRYKLKLLRNTVHVQLPDPFFIPGTIRNNLLLGNEDLVSGADDALLIEALSRAKCDFMLDLPERLGTLIGDGGLQLSAVESKKLSLARAFLHGESRVVVFDEAVTDLDLLSTEVVSRSIESMAEAGALVFWITSRIEDLLLADRVLFFDGASPKPHLGTHEEMLASCAEYRQFLPGFAHQILPQLNNNRRRNFSTPMGPNMGPNMGSDMGPDMGSELGSDPSLNSASDLNTRSGHNPGSNPNSGSGLNLGSRSGARGDKDKPRKTRAPKAPSPLLS